MSSTFQSFEDKNLNWGDPDPVKWDKANKSVTSGFSSFSTRPRALPVSPQDRQDTGSIRRQTNVDGKDQDERETTSRADFSIASIVEEERDVLERARKYSNPSRFFRCIISLYAQRKMNVVFLVHFTSTLIIWFHFAMIKFDEQAETVPEGAHRYWLKRLAPPLEFGSMHAILFQMALLPITMCRFSISTLADSIANRIIPFNRTLRMHIHLGYTMVTVLCVATAFFFFFFGILCIEGEQKFCNKFTMEIMITGYVILGFILIIGVTSFFRYKMPYEIFYAVHHAVFLLYIVTILHTFDVEQRSGRGERSQTFKWFSSSVLYYICDRVAMRLNHCYDTKIIGSSVVWGSNGAKLVILKARRPVLLQFKPGQYVFIKIDAIDNHWHPFSIASDPDSDHLEFYIEVFDGKKNSSWTKKLWHMLDCEYGIDKSNAFSLSLQVMGPYGTSLAGNQTFSHALAIGVGTGVVPILSMYKAHMHSLLRLDPDEHLSEIKLFEETVREIELAKKQRRGSLAQKFARAVTGCRSPRNHLTEEHGRRINMSNSIRRSIVKHETLEDKAQIQTNIRDMKHKAQSASRSIYGTVLLSFLPVVGVSLFALMVSWNTISVELYPVMIDILKFFTITFQGFFAIASIFCWNAEGIFSYVDLVFVVIGPFADLYWDQICDREGRLQPNDLLLYSIFTWYMIVRLWNNAVGPQQSTLYRSKRNHRSNVLDKMTFVWTTRSASQVSEILPDILEMWNTLVKRWGLKKARKVCDVSIYITDPDEEAWALLAKEFEQTEFYRSGGINRGRADMKRVIEDHTIELVSTRHTSHSLLAFCGNALLAREIHHAKISNDMITAMTGNCQSHLMDFVDESYGGVTSSEKKKEAISSRYKEEDTMELLTNRKTVVMDNSELVDSSVTTSWI